MLWNLVYDFFVQYVFGGYTSQGISFDTFIGSLLNNDEVSTLGNNADTFLLTGLTFYDLNEGSMDFNFMTIGNYLSLIATIVSMVAIVLICCALIKKIYNMCAHIIG